jgi:tRNA nucleotidyltransferase/poly(A) polymerase
MKKHLPSINRQAKEFDQGFVACPGSRQAIIFAPGKIEPFGNPILHAALEDLFYMPISSERIELSFVPGDVLRVMETIHGAGADVWIVGGALRDFFLGIEPNDWDLATSASAARIVSIFPRVIPVGIRHGTVQVHTRNRDIEVTSFTPPGEAGLLKDLGRRDFTMNSLALSYPDGILVDAHGAREDLKAGLIKAVGKPAERFSEDPLRIVRAARICAVYGFRIDHTTFDAMREGAEELDSVSGERIRDEILKMLTAAYFSKGFETLKKSGALGRLLPGLDKDAKVETCGEPDVSVFEHTRACILNCPKRTRIRLAALFHNMVNTAPSQHLDIVPEETRLRKPAQTDFRSESARKATQIMKKWNMSNKSIDEISSLVLRQLPRDAPSWSDAELRRFITTVGPELLEDFTALAEAEVLCEARDKAKMEAVRQLRTRLKKELTRVSALSVRELALGGDEIMRILNLSPGPEVGKVLKHLFDLVQEDPGLNTPEHLARIVETKYRPESR